MPMPLFLCTWRSMRIAHLDAWGCKSRAAGVWEVGVAGRLRKVGMQPGCVGLHGAWWRAVPE